MGPMPSLSTNSSNQRYADYPTIRTEESVINTSADPLLTASHYYNDNAFTTFTTNWYYSGYKKLCWGKIFDKWIDHWVEFREHLITTE